MGFDGFDGIELVMGLEDRLNISIPDSEAERLLTPDDVVKYLSTRLQAQNAGETYRCRSAAAFRQGRTKLAVLAELSSESLRPSTRAGLLLPCGASVSTRRSAWMTVADTLGIRMPDLRHDRIHHRLSLLTATVACGPLFPVAWRLLPNASWNPFIVGVICVLSIFSVSRLFLIVTRNILADVIPEGFETVGDITSCLTIETIPNSPSSLSGWTKPELWELVRDLTAKSAGCTPTRIKRNTTWPSLDRL